jgi:hypothetical protein
VNFPSLELIAQGADHIPQSQQPFVDIDAFF